MTKETLQDYLSQRDSEYEQILKEERDAKDKAKDAALLSAKKKKCKKCKKKIIYAIVTCKHSYDWPKLTRTMKYDFLEGLCVDHAPKLSSGKPGYDKITLVEVDDVKVSIGASENDYSFTVYSQDQCHNCGKKIVDINDFIHQEIKNGEPIESFCTLPALPIEELSYYMCKEWCGD